VIRIPLRDFFELGVQYILYVADRNYQDFSDVTETGRELRVQFVWNVE